MDEVGGAKSEGNKSMLLKAYQFIRWPAVLGILALSATFFFTGLLNSLGYNGTTELRKTYINSTEWSSFTNSFSSTPSRGTPFKWAGMQPSVSGEYVNFDQRLIKTLEYLKNGSVSKSATCGWNSSHENLPIDVNYASEWSIYTTPPDKTTPISTIYRGVGLRISQADYIKCTIHPKTPYCSYQVPEKFPIGDPDGFPISLSSNNPLNPTQPYDKANCQVTCASDYYPLLADPAESTPPVHNSEVIKLANYDPKIPFDYEQINSFSRKAALLKSILITYELTHIDDPGCESAQGNTGYDRLVPITLITQKWVREDLGDDNWGKMIDMAEKKFPFGFQRSSPLAALSYDSVLNVLGIHWNF
jgi:hypothetical protein